MMLDPAVAQLLSDSLTRELTLNARGKYIIIHPLFAMISANFDVIYLTVCAAFSSSMHTTDDVVFKDGTWSAGLYIMARGKYKLISVDAEEHFDHTACFSEVGLFARTLGRFPGRSQCYH